MKRMSKRVESALVDADRHVIGWLDEMVVNCESRRISHAIVKRCDQSGLWLAWSDLIGTPSEFMLRQRPAI